MKIVCTLKQKKTQKIMAYHVIMHCDMDISEKKKSISSIPQIVTPFNYDALPKIQRYIMEKIKY